MQPWPRKATRAARSNVQGVRFAKTPSVSLCGKRRVVVGRPGFELFRVKAGWSDASVFSRRGKKTLFMARSAADSGFRTQNHSKRNGVEGPYFFAPASEPAGDMPASAGREERERASAFVGV